MKTGCAGLGFLTAADGHNACHNRWPGEEGTLHDFR